MINTYIYIYDHPEADSNSDFPSDVRFIEHGCICFSIFYLLHDDYIYNYIYICGCTSISMYHILLTIVGTYNMRVDVSA
jgi:hypothetical protein